MEQQLETPKSVITPGLKAAKTRAWKTFQGFSEDEATSLSPSHVFVTLRIPSQKLKQSNIPAIATRWEESLTQKVMNNTIKNSDTQETSLSLRNSERICRTIRPDVQGNEGDGRVVVKDNIGGTAETFSTSTNCDTEPKQSRCTTQPPNFTVEVEPNLYSQSPTGLSIEGIDSSVLCHPLTKISLSNLVISKLVENSRLGQSAHINSSQILTLSSLAVTKGRTNQDIKSPAKKGLLTKDNAERISPFAAISSRKNTNLQVTTTDTSNRGSNIDTQSSKRVQFSADSLPTKKIPQLSVLFNSNIKGLGHIQSEKSVVIKPSLTRSIKRTSQNLPKEPQNPGCPQYPNPVTGMAPVRDPNNVDSSLKDAIQKLYEVQSQVHGFVPETQPLLIDKMTELAHSLAHLQTITSPTLSPNNPIHNNRIAPEVIDYVDDSRNPDIYNREFVELVQRGNAVMNGKQQAFHDFAEIFAKALREGMPELGGQVDMIMENAKPLDRKTNIQKTIDDNANGATKVEKGIEGRKEGEGFANGTRPG